MQSRIISTAHWLLAASLLILPGSAVATDHRNIVSRVPPVYPELARRLRVEGTVSVRATIRPDGTVADTRVESGHAMLAEAAQRAVQQWRFAPQSSSSDLVSRSSSNSIATDHQRLRNEDFMKLQANLGLSTGVLILSMLGSSYIAHIRIQQANRLSASVNNNRLPIISLTRDMRFASTVSVRALESYMLFGLDPASKQRFHKERLDRLAFGFAAMNQLLDPSRHFDLGPDGHSITEFQSGLIRLSQLQDETEHLNELHTSEGAAQAYDLLMNQILPLDASLFASLQDLVKSQETLRDAEMEHLLQANHQVLLSLWMATWFAALIGAMISFLIARRIIHAIDLVARRAKAIAQGDLTGAPLDVRSKDQIGDLASAMQQMQTNLAAIIGAVGETAGTLTTNAACMRTASDQVHRRIDQQTHQTQQAATAMQEMSASIAEVSRHTHSAAESARNASQIARDGGLIVKQALGNIHSIATAVSEASATIALLGEDSSRISRIVTTIDEIARKTNLLALNAAIEAARAGDQGRGFAVVAGEVRRLAESTATATGEIAAMIQGIQNRTAIAIAGMQSGTATVQQGVLTTTQAGESLHTIIDMAEQVDRMITQIAISASQQAVAANQSSSNLDEIHHLSNENLNEMATTAKGIETLRTTAVSLGHQVESFRLQPHMLPPKQKEPAAWQTPFVPAQIIQPQTI